MWIAAIVIAALLVLLALLLVPRGRNADDGPLPTDIETRLLLGERPDDIDRASRQLHPPEPPSGV